MQSDLNTLLTFPLFRKIQAGDLQAMLQCLGAHRKSYPKDSFIFHSNAPLQWIGVILTGSVRMLKEDYTGSRCILAEMHRGDLFGETFACTSPLSSPVAFQASEACEVYLFPFLKILETCSLRCAFHHILIENMVRLIAQKNLLLTQKLEILSQKSIRGRLLTYLFQLANQQQSREVEVPLNRTELAHCLSVDRSALAREIHRLVEEQQLKIDKNVFCLPAALFSGR